MSHSPSEEGIAQRIEEWRFEYNWRRSHGSLGGKTPAARIAEARAGCLCRKTSRLHTMWDSQTSFHFGRGRATDWAMTSCLEDCGHRAIYFPIRVLKALL